jgi:hypothetical protein
MASKRLRIAISPPAEPSERDTGLRFTDVLFGFVIRELFLRLQHWGDLVWYVRWQLIASTALVLGSWIGFRRSLSRTSYEIKFFNVPFFRFTLDQIMVIFYFRIATLTPQDGTPPFPEPDNLTHSTVKALLFVFALYAAWDILGLAMGYLRKYPDNKVDWPSFAITMTVLAIVALVYFRWSFDSFGALRTELVFVLMTILLLVYRFAKEVNRSWHDEPVQAKMISPPDL